jgi:16S rRNA (adenine1518-N6/adenine1519-N6)-dimethyltransferase
MALQKSLGQHFLNNQKAISDIVAAVGVAQSDVIIEIGPGAGAISQPIADLCKKHGAQFFAIEKDTKLVIDIQNQIPILAGHVEHGDALELLPALINKLQAKSYKLVGNIPYYITGHLLRVIGELEHKPAKTVLMIQKEVAERVSSKAPHMNLLAAATQYWGDIKILFNLKPKDFTPPPEVSSAVISITPRAMVHVTRSPLPVAAYYSFIKAAFKQPRKTLLNNLGQAFPEVSRENIADFMDKNGLALTARAQDLNVSDLEKLASAFQAEKSV